MVTRALTPNGIAVAFALTLAAASCGDNITSDPGGDDPAFDQTIPIPGLDGDVEAYVDALGVMHFKCASDDDCYAAQGYFHAAHRFFQMDLRRRLARGRLSELVGAIALDSDHRWRSIMRSLDGTAIEEQLLAAANPETKRAIEAYTVGVNAWLEDLAGQENGARFADEYNFPLIERTFEPWTELDSVASILPIIDQLTNRGASEVALGEIYAALPPAQADDLFGLRPASPSTIIPPASRAESARSISSNQREELRRFRGVLRQARDVLGPAADLDAVGSNNWALAPSQTATGSALLANDPHLALSNPAIWYMVHLDSKTQGGTLHAAGASFPGLPGVIFGQNEDVAWGVTTTLWDQTDIYLETLSADGTAVLLDGVEVPIVNVEYEYKQKGGQASVFRSAQYVPHHGVILAIDLASRTAVSMRWAGQDLDTDINFIVGMAASESVADARDTLAETVTTVGQNFVVADRAGSIGWFPYNRVPARPWASTNPPHLPIPGDGSAEWGDYVEYAQLPQALDPAQGYLATANNDMTGHLADGDASNDGQVPVQAFAASGYRHERILERLAARSDHDLDSMQSIQADTHSLIGERTVPIMLAAVDGLPLTPAAAKIVEALAAWDFDCPTGLTTSDPESSPDATTSTSAIGCSAFHVAWGELASATFADELTAAGLSRLPSVSPLAIAVTQPERLSQSYWDNVSTNPVVETFGTVLSEAFDKAGTFLETELGANSSEWLWGRIHAFTLRADLFDGAGFAEFNNGPYANDGGLVTVDVANPSSPSSGDYGHRAGASARFHCSLAEDAIRCFYDLPGGQRHFAGDPHYDDMLQKWLVNEPTALEFDIATVKDVATESIKLVSP